jgi:hypothetical protein
VKKTLNKKSMNNTITFQPLSTKNLKVNGERGDSNKTITLEIIRANSESPKDLLVPEKLFKPNENEVK